MFYLLSKTHKPFAPQLTPDCGAFFVRFPLLLIICRLQPALLSIHSEQEHYPNNKKGGQCENGDSVRAGQLDKKGKSEGTKNRSEL